MERESPQTNLESAHILGSTVVPGTNKLNLRWSLVEVSVTKLENRTKIGSRSRLSFQTRQSAAKLLRSAELC